MDGIDLDFEGIQSHEQWKSYLKFILTASTTMKQHGLLLTVALHPGQLLPAKVCESVDRVHVMTYDMMNPSINNNANHRRKKHHASMHSVQEAITSFIQNGCPPSKLVMGIPAYGRHGQNMGSVKTYSEIIDGIISEEGSNNNNHEILKTIQSTSSWKGYQFDSPNDIREKVKYAIQTGLGGVFIWELGQDKQIEGAEGGMLLEAAASSSSSVHTHSQDSNVEDHQEL